MISGIVRLFAANPKESKWNFLDYINDKDSAIV